MRTMTTVNIVWEDGRISNESFRDEEDFFKYLDAMAKDGHKPEEYESDNPEWIF